MVDVPAVSVTDNAVVVAVYVPVAEMVTVQLARVVAVQEGGGYSPPIPMPMHMAVMP